MKTTRDEFTKATIAQLAKRVGYVCSNPQCRKLTVGANESKDKSTSIGIAAHITAASKGGPRYSHTLNTEQRRHIDNAIWLCSNCASLIDKDESKFTPVILKKWKEDAEEESRKKLNGQLSIHTGIPYLEVDLIWRSSGRSSRGYSNKNPIELEDGRPVMIITYRPIIHYTLHWGFSLIIFNNSKYPAYNIKIESIGSVHFTHLDKLAQVNNLPPFESRDLSAEYEEFVESDYILANDILSNRIPEKFKNLILKLTYYDDARNMHVNHVEFTDAGIVTKKI